MPALQCKHINISASAVNFNTLTGGGILGEGSGKRGLFSLHAILFI